MLDWMIEEGKKKMGRVAQGLEWGFFSFFLFRILFFSFLFFSFLFFFFFPFLFFSSFLLSLFFVSFSFFLSLLYKKGPFCALVLLKRKQAWNPLLTLFFSTNATLTFVFYHLFFSRCFCCILCTNKREAAKDQIITVRISDVLSNNTASELLHLQKFFNLSFAVLPDDDMACQIVDRNLVLRDV